MCFYLLSINFLMIEYLLSTTQLEGKTLKVNSFLFFFLILIQNKH
jgi:hypothetical protein